MKILVVDDDPHIRLLLAQFLTPIGTVDVAASGIDAVRMFKEAMTGGNPYDFVSLDILMSGMDGHEVLTKIRAIETELGIEDDQRSKVMMVSAQNSQAEISRSFRERCEAYIVKPITKDKVYLCMQKLGLSTVAQEESDKQ